MALRLPIVAALLWPGAAFATTFEFDIVNNSSDTWSEGVVVVLPAPNALVSLGHSPQPSDPNAAAYTFGHDTCDPGGVDDTGDAALLIQRTSALTEGINAWVVPSLSPGQATTVQIDASPGEVMSFEAWVQGSDDDVVLMHAIGDYSDTTIDLFNQADLPLFHARFDIGGYDLNARNTSNGAGPSCASDCPASGANCNVAPHNSTTGIEAGGDQPAPDEPELGVFPGYALSPVPGTFYQNGIGSPTVVRRNLHDDYVMFFETNTGTADNCPVGTWGIGVATSPDGWNWTVRGNAPVVPPRAGTYFSCVAAHPTAVLDEGGTHIHLWFKGEQGNDCDTENPPTWGCDRYTGVGYAAMNGNNLTAPPVTHNAEPIQMGDVFGFPSVTRIDGTWTMLLQKYPNFYKATAPAPEGPWTLDAEPTMEIGITPWSATELFNPSLICETDTDPTVFPYTNWFGGRTRSSQWGPITDGGMGKAISADAQTWFLGATPFSIANDDDWRHWDSVRVGTDYLVWYSQKDPSGKNNVGLAGTVDQWDDTAISTRICPQPGWW